jgi:hypothetical protein
MIFQCQHNENETFFGIRKSATLKEHVSGENVKKSLTSIGSLTIYLLFYARFFL